MDMYIRLGCFLGVLVVINVYEYFVPWRVPVRGQRWVSNYGLVVLGAIFVRLVFPVSSIVWADWVEVNGQGLFYLLNLNAALSFILGLIILDLAIYAQHWIFHQWTWAWNLHRVHHCDVHLDSSSALRFHPLEIGLSMAFKFLLIWMLGLSSLVVLTFEVILNSCAIFNHGNVKLPRGLERVARFVIVTPDMHRIHHSSTPRETNSNYGFNLSIWDRLFHTYTDPSAKKEEIQIGLKEEKSHNLWDLLRLPF